MKPASFPFPPLTEKIQSFSLTHIIILICGIIIFTTGYIVAKKYLSTKGQWRLLWGMWFTILFFVLWNSTYKMLYLKLPLLDKEGEFYNPARWFNELIPLTMCRLNFFMFLFALVSKKRCFKAYAFFISMIGTICALIILVVNLDNYVDYFVTHFIYAAFPIYMVGFGFYTPRVKDFMPAIKTFAVMYFYVHLMNTLLTALGDSVGVPYYVNNINTMGAFSDKGDISIFVMLYNIIKMPYFYFFLFLVGAIPVWCLLSLCFIKRNDDKKTYAQILAWFKAIPTRLKQWFVVHIKQHKAPELEFNQVFEQEATE